MLAGTDTEDEREEDRWRLTGWLLIEIIYQALKGTAEYVVLQCSVP